MKTLLVVLTHPEAEPILRMNFPWLKRADCEILTVNHHGTAPSALALWQIGGPPNSHPLRWLGRFLDVAQRVACAYSDYNRFIFCESDTIFVRPPPEHSGTGATLAGYASDGFVSTHFSHCPWQFTAGDLAAFLDRAQRITRIGLTEQGFIDRFIGLYEDLYGPVIARHPNFSMNTIQPEHVPEARQALLNGGWACHGVKSPDVLAQLTEGL